MSASHFVPLNNQLVSLHFLSLSRSRLRISLFFTLTMTLTVNGNVLILDGLDDKIAHHAAVVRVHPRTECIEDSSHAHL